MALPWWDIPGPARFVRSVESDLLDRVNVVAALPGSLGKNWFEFFRRRWGQSQGRLEQLRPPDEACSPLDELCGAFTTRPRGTTSVGDLVMEPGFRGRTIGVFVERPGPIAAWAEFLDSYERACRSVEPFERTVLLLATSGVTPARLPAPATHLRVHLYDGYARPQDCYMYAWGLLGAEEKHGWRTDLKMALCAQLGQWDPRLCETLVDRDLGALLSRKLSESVLTGEAPMDVGGDLDDGWARGILQRRDDQIVYHSGWNAEGGASAEFERRVWTAQVQVVFPLIEQVRRNAIQTYGHHIRLPVVGADGEEINDLSELEIAMVCRLLSRSGRVPRGTLRRLEQAKAFRNALAHLEPLTSQQLLAFEPTLDR